MVPDQQTMDWMMRAGNAGAGAPQTAGMLQSAPPAMPDMVSSIPQTAGPGFLDRLLAFSDPMYTLRQDMRKMSGLPPEKLKTWEKLLRLAPSFHYESDDFSLNVGGGQQDRQKQQLIADLMRSMMASSRDSPQYTVKTGGVTEERMSGVPPIGMGGMDRMMGAVGMETPYF